MMIYYVAMPQRIEAELQGPYDLPIESDFQICPVCGVYLSHRPNRDGKRRSHFSHRHAPDIQCPLYDPHGGSASIAKRASRTKPDFTIDEWKSMLDQACGLERHSVLDWMDQDPSMKPMLNTAGSRLARGLPELATPADYIPGRLKPEDMDLLLLTSLSRPRNQTLRHELLKVACHVTGCRWRSAKGSGSPRFLFQNADEAREKRLEARHPGFVRPHERQAIEMLIASVSDVLAKTHP